MFSFALPNFCPKNFISSQRVFYDIFGMLALAGIYFPNFSPSIGHMLKIDELVLKTLSIMVYIFKIS